MPYTSSMTLYMWNCKYSRVLVIQPKCCYESQNTVVVFSCTVCVQHVIAAITVANYILYLLCSNWTQPMSKCHDTSLVMSSVCAENLLVAMVKHVRKLWASSEVVATGVRNHTNIIQINIPLTELNNCQQVHLTSESGKKMERKWTNKSDGSERRWRKCCGVSCTLKKSH